MSEFKHTPGPWLVSPPENLRIKPTPKLRPWRPEEVPVGALIRRLFKARDEVVILGVSITGNYPRVIVSDLKFEHGSNLYLSDLFTYHGGHNGDRMEHSTDQGKTWLPCGVEE